MPNFVINYTSAQVEGKNIDDRAIVNDCKNDIDKATRIGNFSHEREYSLFKHFKTEVPDFEVDRMDIDNLSISRVNEYLESVSLSEVFFLKYPCSLSSVERRKIFFRSNDNKSGSSLQGCRLPSFPHSNCLPRKKAVPCGLQILSIPISHSPCILSFLRR